MKTRFIFKNIFLPLLAVTATLLPVLTTQAQTLGTPKQEKLLNGLKVLMWNTPAADKVRVKLRIHAGSAFDPQGKEGLMQLLADHLFPTSSTRELFVEDLGGSLDVRTTYDYIEIDASAKPDSLLTVLETLSEAVSNLAVDKETLPKMRSTPWLAGSRKNKATSATSPIIRSTKGCLARFLTADRSLARNHRFKRSNSLMSWTLSSVF